MKITIKGNHDLPAGKYHAVMSGYEVKVGNATYEADSGIRGTGPAVVTVDAQGVATVEVK